MNARQIFAKYEHVALGPVVKVALISPGTAYRITRGKVSRGGPRTHTIVFARHMGPDYGGRVISADSYNRTFTSKEQAIGWAQQVGRFLR